MFNFLKKKGKEKSNFFDNKVVSTPKSSKIFRKFVQSDMGQNSSLDKSSNKKTLKKSDSKDEEYNTAPNSPEVEKNDSFSDSFLAIDDDFDLGSSTSLLQNNQAPNRPDSSSPGTSRDTKAALTPKPSVLLKSSPDAFYTKKNNNNGNKQDLRSQITNGSQNVSCSSQNNSFHEDELRNNFQNSNRRNSDSNKQETPIRTNTKNTSKLSKQNSADSVLSNTRNSSQQTNGFIIKNNRQDVVFDSENTQTYPTSDSKSNSDQKTDRNSFINSFSKNVLNKNNGVFEETKKQSISEVNSRRESVDSVSESASIVIKTRTTPVYNKLTDENDSDTSLDSYSITASFEIKEALLDSEEKENSFNSHDGGNNENVTYLRCPENITTTDTEGACSREDASKSSILPTEINVINHSEKEEENNAVFLNNNLKCSLQSKTENNSKILEIDDRITKHLVHHEEDRTSVDLPLILNNEENIVKKSCDSSMCLSGSGGELNNEHLPEPEQSNPEPQFALGKAIEETDITSIIVSDDRPIIQKAVDLKDRNVDGQEQGIILPCEPEQSKLKIEEEAENKEIPTQESESEEDESEEDEKVEEEEEENTQVPKVVDIKQMDADLLLLEPRPKVKKFVRFALIHNTYHGSDTSESEEEEDEEEVESEEEESEEEEEEEENEDMNDEELSKKAEENKPEVDDSLATPEALLQLDDIVHDMIPVEIVPESNESIHESVVLHINEVEPQKDPFENEKLEYEAQIRKLQTEKADYEDRVHNLTSDLELKQLELNQFKGKIGELENQVLTKTWAMDRQEAELVSASKESEHVRQKLRRLENDLTEYRLKNSDLTEELVRKTAEEVKRKEDTCDFFKIRELEEKLFDSTEMIKTLEEQLNGIKKNQEEAKAAEKIMKAETEVEMKIMREALDEALKQKSILQKRFESEFNQLRSTSTAQEQQLLDDFEWKLREVEQSCKKKILEAEKCKRDLEAQLLKVTAELEELSKFKNVEAELAQLRSVSHEHQRTIRTITRQKEELQVNEKILNEELTRLRTALEKEKNHISTLQAIHSREITEKNRKHQFKLEQQKNELQEQFEERLKKEALRVKVESEKHHLEDKRVAIEHTRAQADTKLQEQKKKWEKQLADAQRQVETFKDRLKESESLHRQEVESAQTHSDQNMLELRRKFDKLDMGYQEQIEKAQEKHEQEIERLTEEFERRLSQCESSWQQQLSTTRTTLELVKEQLRRDSYEQVQQLKTQHQRELEEQWSRLIQERDEALAELEQRHRATIEQLRTEIEIRTKKSHAEAELRERVRQLEQDLQSSHILIQSLQSSLQATTTQQRPNQEPHKPTQEPQRPTQDKRKRTSSERQRTGSESNTTGLGLQDQTPSKPATQSTAGPSQQETTSMENDHHSGNTGQSKRKKRNRNRNRQ